MKLRTQMVSTCEHGANCEHERLAHVLLGYVPLSTGLKRALDDNRVVVHREDKQGQSGVLEPSLSNQLEAVAVPERNVNDGQIG